MTIGINFPNSLFAMIDTLDLMLPDEIKAGLGTEVLGAQVISYTQTTSTNDVALDLAVRGMHEGTLVVAESQTKGRGRWGRKWISPMGTSILASLILRPPIMTHEAHIITLISASAVAQAVRIITGLPALIKWPNDVTINGKKVSGVLTEMRTENQHVSFLVVGIGVTVNIPQNRFPKEISGITTSLSIESGREIPRVPLLQEILRQLEYRYIKLKEHGPGDFVTEWKDLSAIIGHKVEVILSKRVVHGRALDIDETGALMVQMDTGQMLRITDADVLQIKILKQEP